LAAIEATYGIGARNFPLAGAWLTGKIPAGGRRGCNRGAPRLANTQTVWQTGYVPDGQMTGWSKAWQLSVRSPIAACVGVLAFRWFIAFGPAVLSSVIAGPPNRANFEAKTWQAGGLEKNSRRKTDEEIRTACRARGM